MDLPGCADLMDLLFHKNLQKKRREVMIDHLCRLLRRSSTVLKAKSESRARRTTGMVPRMTLSVADWDRPRKISYSRNPSSPIMVNLKLYIDSPARYYRDGLSICSFKVNKTLGCSGRCRLLLLGDQCGHDQRDETQGDGDDCRVAEGDRRGDTDQMIDVVEGFLRQEDQRHR